MGPSFLVLYFLRFAFFPLAGGVFAGFAFGLAFFPFTGAFTFLTGALFFFGEAGFDFPFADAFTLPFFFPSPDALCPFALTFDTGTNFSTVQPTLTETTSSPGFTSTTTSPLVDGALADAGSIQSCGFRRAFGEMDRRHVIGLVQRQRRPVELFRHVPGDDALAIASLYREFFFVPHAWLCHRW